MVSTLLVAAQAIASHPILPRAGLVLMGIVMVAAIALTYSRSAWVGLAAGLAYLAVVKERRLLLVGALALGGLLLLPQTQPFVGRFTAGLELRDQATLMRLDEYRNALAIIEQYPFFGIGFGDAPSIELSVGVSSLYLLVAEQMGLVGLAAFLVLILVAGVAGLQVHAPRASPRWATLSGLQAALVGALVAGLFDHYFFNLRFPHMVALFWLLLGLLFVARSLSHGSTSLPIGTGRGILEGGKAEPG
jgi:O-antigen ligase